MRERERVRERERERERDREREREGESSRTMNQGIPLSFLAEWKWTHDRSYVNPCNFYFFPSPLPEMTLRVRPNVSASRGPNKLPLFSFLLSRRRCCSCNCVLHNGAIWPYRSLYGKKTRRNVKLWNTCEKELSPWANKQKSRFVLFTRSFFIGLSCEWWP